MEVLVERNTPPYYTSTAGEYLPHLCGSLLQVVAKVNGSLQRPSLIL